MLVGFDVASVYPVADGTVQYMIVVGYGGAQQGHQHCSAVHLLLIVDF